MKKLKITAIVIGSLCALAVIAVGLALNSAVQTWAVRKAVAGQPGTKIEVSRVSAGFSETDVNDFQFEQDGMIVTAKGVNAKYSAWDFIRSRRINADSVTVDDLVVDLRKAQPAPASTGKTAPPSSAPAAKPTPFDGLLKQLQLALDVRVGTVDVKGRALLPDDQTVVFNLKGARIETGQQGNLEWSVDFADSKVGATLKSLRTTGTLAVRITPDRRIDLIAIEGSAAALGPKIPAEQFRLTLRAEQPKVGGDENYAINLGLVRGTAVEPLLKVAAAWTAAAREIAGTWEVGLRSEQLAALFSGLGLPEIGADGSGKFAVKPDTTAATASGRLTARASQLEKLSPELATIGSMTLTSRFDGAFADDTARLDALDLDITAADGRKFAQIGLLQKISFGVKDQRLTLTNPQAEAARLSVQALPLAWAQPWLKDITIESGDLSEVSAIEAEPDGRRVRIRAIEPLTLRNVTIRDAQKKLLLDRVTLSVRPALDYSATKVTAQLAALSITMPAGDSVSGTLSAEVTNLATTPIVAFSGQIQAKLVSAHKPYLPAGLDLGPLALAQTIEGRLEGKSLQLSQVSSTVTREGGALLSAVELLQPVRVDLSALTFAVATPSATAARVRLGEVPLAWGEAFVPKSKFSGSFAGATIEVTMRSADDLSIATTEPIALRGVSVALDGKPQVESLDLSASFSATKRGDAVTYDLKKIDVRQGDTALATLAVSGEATLGAKFSARAKGRLDADAAALLKQPALAGTATLARGDATAEFDAHLADATTVTLAFAAKDLLAKQGGQPLGTFEGKATATLAADGSGSINAPFTLTNGDRKSDLTLNGTFRKASDKVTLEVAGKIDSTNLIVDDFQALAALSPAQAPAPEKPAPTVVRAPRPTAPPAPTPPVRDTQPFWHGALGKVDVDLKRVLYGKDAEVRSVLCSATIAENTLTLDTLEGKYRETAFKLATKVDFAPPQAKPYTLVGTFDVTGFDVGAVLRAANPADEPSVETTVAMMGRFNGTGLNLEDLAQGVYGRFSVTSSKGVLRALSKNSTAGKVIGGVSTVANAAVGVWSLLGKTPPPQASAAAETSIDLAKALGELPFDLFSASVERGADLNFTLTALEFLSPTMHVTGSGTITRSPSAPEAPLTDWPMNVEIQFGAKGGLATLLKVTRVLGTATDDKGYTLLRQPFPVTGTPAKPDSSALWKMIATAAISDGGSAIQSGASALEGLLRKRK
ncbi:MAG: hypothetical protein JNK23_17830 [Opitutaceae bacterium]|nr:hypothetical protein [Opitutaceae bacterium]